MRPALSDLLQKLYAPRPGVVRRLSRKEDGRVAIVGQVRAFGDPIAAPYLVPLLFESNELAVAVSQAVAELLSDVSPEDIVRLDEGSRCEWYLPYRWYEVRPKDVSRLSIDSTTRPAVFGALSWHPNGHVRQKATEGLATISDGAVVPFLLVRLNDWVRQVRDVARRAVMQRLERREFGSFFANLHLVFRLVDCRRDEHSPVINAVVRVLIDATAEVELADALGSPSRFVRRSCYRLTMAEAGDHHQHVIKHGLQSSDGVLRLWASRDARSELTDEELTGALTSLLHDRFLPVRREALITVLERFLDRAKAALWCALLDRSASLREFARFHLRKTRETDFAEFYREALRAERQLPQSILGLGETGKADDCECFCPLVESDRPAIRQATTRALGMLAGDEYAPTLFEAVKDDNKKVSAEASRALIPRVHLLPLNDISEALKSDSRAHVRLAAISLVNAIDVWDGLPFLIEAAADMDEYVSFVATRKVLGRVNRVFTKPSPQQRTLIAETLARCSDRLPDSFAHECREWLECLY